MHCSTCNARCALHDACCILWLFFFLYLSPQVPLPCRIWLLMCTCSVLKATHVAGDTGLLQERPPTAVYVNAGGAWLSSPSLSSRADQQSKAPKKKKKSPPCWSHLGAVLFVSRPSCRKLPRNRQEGSGTLFFFFFCASSTLVNLFHQAPPPPPSPR